MAKGQRRGVWVRALSTEDKAAIATVCERFIADRLKPRFLSRIRPTELNYPVDIFGKWRGDKYSFVTRYRSGFTENLGAEFDAPFTRLDHLEERLGKVLFDVMWKRHTGQWFRLYAGLTLEDALQAIENGELLWPLS